MLKEIIEEVEWAVDDAYNRISNNDYVSFILYIGRADVVPQLKYRNRSEYVIDYKLDNYYDKTREGFYLRYLNRNYTEDGFRYENDCGLDDLTIEMMIYTHLWESLYFLKSLIRMSFILRGEGYKWKLSNNTNKYKWEYMHDEIINPLKEKGIALGDIVEKAYSSEMRNAFAHALYTVNSKNRTITMHTKEGINTISFEAFQQKFLYSVVLMEQMLNTLEFNHNKACEQNKALTNAFITPNGIRIQVIAETADVEGTRSHRLRLVRLSC